LCIADALFRERSANGRAGGEPISLHFTGKELSRVFAKMALFAASTVFWMAYMQMFGSFTLLA
jgi:hypothetical protein